jgi:hypothetical protein
MPNLLQGIVLSILTRQPDFAVVEIEENGERDLVVAIRSHKLDVLVTTRTKRDSSQPPIDLLYARPYLSVLGLEPGGGEAVLYSLKPQATRLPGVSPSELVDAVHSVADAVDEG